MLCFLLINNSLISFFPQFTADVFSDTQPLIRSVLDGFNVCIFAYGQTGSGKTYTMVLTLVLRIIVNFLSYCAGSVVDYIIISLIFSLSIYIFTFQSGPSTSKKDWGVNYRALNDLFDISLNRRNIFSYEVGVQMVEIYNEQVRDLLSNKIAQKRYPFDNIAWIFLVTFLIIMFLFIFLYSCY